MIVDELTWIFRILGLYLVLGCIFALYFSLKGANKLDPSAVEGTWGFRILIFPAAAALWPLLAIRLIKGVNQPPLEENAHRKGAESPGGEA